MKKLASGFLAILLLVLAETASGQEPRFGISTTCPPADCPDMYVDDRQVLFLTADKIIGSPTSEIRSASEMVGTGEPENPVESWWNPAQPSGTIKPACVFYTDTGFHVGPCPDINITGR